MRIRLHKIEIENFRGIEKANVRLEDVNFLVGDNGTGKTAFLAAISRLMPALRNEDRIFLDADFRFDDLERPHKIKITYEIEIIDDSNVPDKYVNALIEVSGDRTNKGDMRSHLNAQLPGQAKISFQSESNFQLLLEQLRKENLLRQRIIRNGWVGGRITPISLKEGDTKQRHAATSQMEESGYFDGLRARFVQLLLDTEIGKIVREDHPNLLRNTLHFLNEFLGEERFINIVVVKNEQLVLQRKDGYFQPWEGLSGGEQSAFNLAMAIEFERRQGSQILLFEEPETNLHPRIQRDFCSIIKTHLPHRQIFIATHSPSLFEKHMAGTNIILAKKTESKLTFLNADGNFGLFSQLSWGEIVYHAYSLPTFEFHNELYGWIQEITGNHTEKQIENYFTSQHGCIQNKQWIRVYNNGTTTTNNSTIMTYIRNFTHHPENTHNQMYTDAELSDSISIMIKIAKTLK